MRITLIAFALVIAACGAETPATNAPTTAATTAPTTTGATTSSTSSPDTTSTSTTALPTTTAAAEGSVVATADSPLGEIIVDAEGRTLYVFDNDSEGTSTCTGGCAETWPALLTDGEPAAEGTADPSLVGTSEREDGSLQVTYNGRPLYRFSGDTAAGETNGQGIGGVWWVIDAAGQAVEG